MWDSSELYKFMCVHCYALGYDIKSKYKDYTSEQLAPIFTRRFLKLLDLSALVSLPFVDFVYEGNGDIKSWSVSRVFCFDSEQITDLMNFLPFRVVRCHGSSSWKFSAYHSHCIADYLLRGSYLYKLYV